MALAALCADLAKHDKIRPKLTAFIVDHKLREGSADEARTVAEWLEQKLGRTKNPLQTFCVWTSVSLDNRYPFDCASHAVARGY